MITGWLLRSVRPAMAAIAVSCCAATALADGADKDKGKQPAPPATVPGPQPLPAQEPLDGQVRRPTGSLWTSASRSMIADYRAAKVGDVLTIIVQETAVATSTASTKSDKSDSANFGGGTGLLRSIFRDFGASASSSFSGQGQTSRTGSLAARVTVFIKEVLPNGNLLVEGSRTVGVNKETQKITLTGVVRPQDVTADNTVSSIQVAEATIKYDGKGPVGDRQRKGLLSRLFDWIF